MTLKQLVFFLYVLSQMLQSKENAVLNIQLLPPHKDETLEVSGAQVTLYLLSDPTGNALIRY